jgi:hypothetical protein
MATAAGLTTPNSGRKAIEIQQNVCLLSIQKHPKCWIIEWKMVLGIRKSGFISPYFISPYAMFQTKCPLHNASKRWKLGYEQQD